MAPGDGRLPRRPLRADGADHEQRCRRTSAGSTASPTSTTSERADLRDLLEQAVRPGPARRDTLGSHNEAYQRVRGLMASEKLFDITQEPQKVRDRYGPTQFGEQALIARRLVEAGRAVRPRRPGLVGQPRAELRDAPGDGARTRPRHGDAARRPEGARPARRHAGRHAGRVRPHAADQRRAWAATTSPAPGA